jgi:hypothetical protein
MRGFVQFAAIAATTLLLQGCQPQYPMSPVFGGSLSPEDNAGVAVIGQSVEAGGRGGFLSKCPSIQSYWARLGKVEAGEPPGFLAVFASCPERAEDPVAYNVMKIRPGTYILKTVTEKQAYEKDIGEFNTGSVPKFTIAKGEVIYLGDLVFTARHPHNLVTVNRDDATAQTTLDKYGVNRPLVFRPFALQNVGNSAASK